MRPPPPPLAQAVAHIIDYLLIPSPDTTGVRELLPQAELKSVLAGR